MWNAISLSSAVAAGIWDFRDGWLGLLLGAFQ
jgi:hypothetical protein